MAGDVALEYYVVGGYSYRLHIHFPDDILPRFMTSIRNAKSNLYNNYYRFFTVTLIQIATLTGKCGTR